MNKIHDQTLETINRIQVFVGSSGVIQGERATSAVAETLLWLRYFEATNEDGRAAELLAGARAFVIEAVAYISLGLGRAAVSAIRGQIDLLLCYTYFRDHPTEWEQVERTGDGFKLRSSIYRYHEETSVDFTARLGIVENVADYTLAKLYQILSAHIHGQTGLTIPQTDSLYDVVLSEQFISSIVLLQEKVSIALSNFLASVYAPHWQELPADIVRRIRNSLPPKQRPRFFAD